MQHQSLHLSISFSRGITIPFPGAEDATGISELNLNRDNVSPGHHAERYVFQRQASFLRCFLRLAATETELAARTRDSLLSPRTNL